MRLLALFTLLFALPISGWTQVSFKYGPELGVSISQFSEKDSHTIEPKGDKVTEKTLPLFSPVVGFNGQMIIKDHLQLGLSLQYQKTGKRYHYHLDGTDLLYGGTYTTYEWEDQTFQKLILPLTVGYSFKAGPLQSAVFAGTKPNFLIRGNYYAKTAFDHTNNAQDFSRENEFNPLDAEQAEIPATRFRNQLIFGVSSIIEQKFKFTLSYSMGHSIDYAQYETFGSEGSYEESMLNQDMGISCVYFIN